MAWRGDATWQTRKPLVPYSVGWICVYPRVGQLAKIPGACAAIETRLFADNCIWLTESCELDSVLLYGAVGKAGQIFSSTDRFALISKLSQQLASAVVWIRLPRF